MVMLLLLKPDVAAVAAITLAVAAVGDAVVLTAVRAGHQHAPVAALQLLPSPQVVPTAVPRLALTMLHVPLPPLLANFHEPLLHKSSMH